jgi:ATP-dependent helicase HrpB
MVLQPRRIAARAAAARVAEERGWTLGREVGYQVRLERRTTRATRLRFVTEGILTRQLLADPWLESVGAVVLDEFHERSIHTDLALALLREAREEVRPDLILVVMSATVDAGPVAQFLGDCPVLRAEGRSHPVTLEYRPVDRPASGEALIPIVQEWLEEPGSRGHLLVFLPGWAEIRRAGRRLEPLAQRAGAVVLPLHGSLPPAEQDRALRPSDRRKIILSTNIAETSLTIDGVTAVIDSGLARIVRYDADRGIDRWSLDRISRASADQRAGRAGRTGPGRCIRLWSPRDERGRPAFEPPEIHRVDLCATVLALHSWGQSDPARFAWFEPPVPERIDAAERLLVLLGAVEGEPPRITPLGRRILELPVHPRLGRLLLAAGQGGRLRDGAAIAALLSEKDIVARGTSTSPRGSLAAHDAGAASDVLVRLDLLAEAEAAGFAPSLRARGIDPAAARQAVLLRDELLRRGRQAEAGAAGPGATDTEPDEDEAILRWLLLAYPDRLVKRRGAEGTGLMVGGRGARLAPGSVVRDAELYLALDAREDDRGGRREVQVSLASAVRPAWLEEFFPQHLQSRRATRYDAARERVIGATQLWYHDLLLREDIGPSPADAAEAGCILAETLRPRAARLVRDDPRVGAWLDRVEFLRRAVPELEWPAFEDRDLAGILDEACIGKSSLEEVRRVDLLPFLQARLGPQQARELHDGAPESVALPTGRRARLTYEPGRPPVLAARVQELFGWTETPRLARGRVPILLHILGPNHRPVQITDDLRSFWTTTYHQVRKDLRGRYPKHAWPEDPANARPAPPKDRK